MFVAPRNSSSQLATRATFDWTVINEELFSLMSPVKEALNCDAISTDEAASAFPDLIGAHLRNSGVLVDDSPPGPHRDRAIIRLTERLRRLKSDLRRCGSTHLMSAVRLHNKCLRAARKDSARRSTVRQENCFRKNPWKFAQETCRPPDKTIPNFSAQTCLQYFESVMSSPAPYNDFPEWISEVWELPVSVNEFDMSPIRPREVKQVLKRCSSTSAPGPDGITYSHLKKLPSCHNFLATLYSKILLQSHSAPISWCQGKTILLYKKGDTSLPKNFRPITLTSVIGKLFHRILSLRLEKFVLSNKLLDSSIQKGFLFGINGTMEHIFCIDSLLANARSSKEPIVMSFLDLKNAFGSVCHQFLFDVLRYLNLPPYFISYIVSCYSQLCAYVSTAKWNTTIFHICRGVFQGDPLSPLLFNLAINPLFAFLSKSEYCGYSAQLLVPHSDGLPPIGIPIYVLWSDSSTDSPAGWYRGNVTSYHCDGSCCLHYDNGDIEPSVDLRSTEWCFAGRYRKNYRADKPVNTIPSASVRAASAEVKFCSTKVHKAKGFADDLTVISNRVDLHQQALTSLVLKAADICFEFQPPKCVSLHFNGHRVVPTTEFSMSDGKTINICSISCTKFLGKTIGTSPTATCKLASDNIKQQVLLYLQRIDNCSIRGEYKVWILKNFVTSVLHFHTAVERLTISSIQSAQSSVLKFVKRWLNLPRNCTPGTVFHPDVLDLPFLPHFKESAKLSYILAVERSVDPMIVELRHSLLSTNFQDASSVVFDALSAAKTSVSNIQSSTFKSEARCSLRSSHVDYWNSTLESLTVQNKFLDIVTLEQSCPLWKRLMYGLPEKQLSFLLRAGCDTLPTPLNLARWNIIVSPICPLCPSTQPTTNHVLTGCSTALNQGRYTWRHDSVLQVIFLSFKKDLPSCYKLYADLPGCQASVSPLSTIPPHITSTLSRPDLVLVSTDSIVLLELSVVTNSQHHFVAAKTRKEDRYGSLLSDLQHAGYVVDLVTVEVGCLGHFMPETVSKLSTVCHLPKRSINQILQRAARVAISCSYRIFNSRTSLLWDVVDLMNG